MEKIHSNKKPVRLSSSSIGGKVQKFSPNAPKKEATTSAPRAANTSILKEEQEKIDKVEPELKAGQRKVEIDELGHPYVMIKRHSKKHGLRTFKVHPDLIDVEKKKRDMELVRGKFKLYERDGGTLKMSWCPTFLGERPKQYTFKDGEIRSIPRALSEHLRERGKVPVHVHAKDEHGRPSQKIGTYRERFDFFEIGAIVTPREGKRIITVENI